jgi:hypothetical protein
MTQARPPASEASDLRSGERAKNASAADYLRPLTNGRACRPRRSALEHDLVEQARSSPDAGAKRVAVRKLSCVASKNRRTLA